MLRPVVLIVLADRDGWKPGHPTVEKVIRNMMELGYAKPEQRERLDKSIKSLYDGPEKSLSFAVKNAAFFGMALMIDAKNATVSSSRN